MAAESLSPTEMRIILTILGLIVLVLIYWFGKPGRRPSVRRRDKPVGRRVEPTLGGDEAAAATDEADTGEPVQSELDVALPDDDQVLPAAHYTALGARSGGKLPGRRTDSRPPERIVSLLVTAREDQEYFRGPDIVVAAEKAGLVFGDLGIFHRLHSTKVDSDPVFSVANMVKPGAFDMTSIQELKTPGLTLFMTLPGPLPALDAWDTMLPAARRLAELLNGRVVDDQRNAMGRQRVAYIRDELRAWDREREV